LVIPGGFGVAKNFCSFAYEGENFTVDKDIEHVIKAFHKQNKQIGASCISPIVLAKVIGTKFGGPGCQITLGNKGVSITLNLTKYFRRTGPILVQLI
jgi:enhancing lycopene biosynthesis protein 2